jgi:hypothetical protein
MSSIKEQKKRKKGDESDKATTSSVKIKDFSLTIFHALAKFLYNKRMNGSEPPQSMPPSVMKNLNTRPKFYESHDVILR